MCPPAWIVFKCYFVCIQPKTVQYRDYPQLAQFSPDAIIADLIQSNLNSLPASTLDANKAYAEFCDTFKTSLDKHAPLKLKILRENHAPFITKELSKGNMIRYRLKLKFNRHWTKENWNAYKIKRNKCIQLRKKAIKSYFEQNTKSGDVNNKGSVIFYREGGGALEIFKFCEFLVIPLLYEWNFSDPPWSIAEFKWSPPPTLIIKVAELVSVFEAEINHPLGLLKVKAGNLRGTLIVVWIKLQNSHHINIFYTTDKKFSRQLFLIPSYFLCYGKQVTMATERYFYISAVWRCRRPRFGIEVTVDLKSNFCVWLLG